MKNYWIIVISMSILAACNQKTAQVPTVKITTEPKGEFAFLMQYNGHSPSDIGFLTNHVVERRLANIMKDSFQVFMSKTKYDAPVMVSEKPQLVAAIFFTDSDRMKPSASVLIDVANDALWADYMNGDTVIEFTDHPSMKKPVPGAN